MHGCACNRFTLCIHHPPFERSLLAIGDQTTQYHADTQYNPFHSVPLLCRGPQDTSRSGMKQKDSKGYKGLTDPYKVTNDINQALWADTKPYQQDDQNQQGGKVPNIPSRSCLAFLSRIKHDSHDSYIIE